MNKKRYDIDWVFNNNLVDWYWGRFKKKWKSLTVCLTILFSFRDAMSMLFGGCLPLFNDIFYQMYIDNYILFSKASIMRQMLSQCKWLSAGWLYAASVVWGLLRHIWGLLRHIWGLLRRNKWHLRAALLWLMWGLPCCGPRHLRAFLLWS